MVKYVRKQKNCIKERYNKYKNYEYYLEIHTSHKSISHYIYIDCVVFRILLVTSSNTSFLLVRIASYFVFIKKGIWF